MSRCPKRISKSDCFYSLGSDLCFYCGKPERCEVCTFELVPENKKEGKYALDSNAECVNCGGSIFNAKSYQLVIPIEDQEKSSPETIKEMVTKQLEAEGKDGLFLITKDSHYIAGEEPSCWCRLGEETFMNCGDPSEDCLAGMDQSRDVEGLRDFKSFIGEAEEVNP